VLSEQTFDEASGAGFAVRARYMDDSINLLRITQELD